MMSLRGWIMGVVLRVMGLGKGGGAAWLGGA